MKKLFLILMALIPVLAFCQDLPVRLNVQTIKTGEDTYSLQIDVMIKEGWHVFARADKDLGIEPLHISLDNENISLPNDPGDGISFNTVMIHDSLFNGKAFNVYIKNMAIEKTIKIKGNTPFLNITLRGFASNSKKILPIEISKEVKIKI